MTLADNDYEADCLQKLLYGMPQEKIASLDWLYAHQSWDAKRWVQGLLYDNDPAVRVRAARYIADIQYLTYLPDLTAARAAEKDPDTAAALQQQLERLLSLRKR